MLFLGFDAVATAAEEVKRPQRNVPIGLLVSLFICTVLYVGVSFVLTGMVPFTELNVADPVAYALRTVGEDRIARVVIGGSDSRANNSSVSSYVCICSCILLDESRWIVTKKDFQVFINVYKLHFLIHGLQVY
ncbi:amino acid permease [Bacillus cereus]